MTVVTSATSATIETSAVSLARYAQIIRYDENAFFGVNAPTNRERACRKIWTKLDRDMIARYLGEAQQMIEQVLLYPIGLKWFEDEQHKNVCKFFTKWGYVRTLGAKAVSNIALSVALNHATDPATIVATATTVTDADEIYFYQAGTDIEAIPDTLTLSGGAVTATFPRARLVLVAYQDNPDNGLDYNDLSLYAAAVDIKRIYTDTSDVGEFVWPLGRENCAPECGEDTEPACGYIQASQSGIVTLLPETGVDCIYVVASALRINYSAGRSVDKWAEDAIIHLAHSLMPVMPCDGCDTVMMLWKNDRFIPDPITQERANSLYGVYDGAWRAWTYALKNRHVRLSFI